MTVDVASGTGTYDGTDFAWSASATLAITAADATNPRLDLITVSSAGTVAAVSGTAAAHPVFPDPGTGVIVLAAVYVPASATTISAANIIDKRVGISDQFLLANGNRPLTDDWAPGAFNIGDFDFTSKPVALEVGDANFNLALSGGAPNITLDSGDILAYDRTGNQFAFYIGSIAKHLLGDGTSLFGGYLRVGSLSAPTNTTAGDLTATRLSLGNAALGASTGYTANLSSTLTDTTSGAKLGVGIGITIDPASASSSEFRALVMSVSTPSSNTQNFSQIHEAVYAANQPDGTGNYTGTIFGGLIGVLGLGVSTSAATGGTISAATGVTGVAASFGASSTKTITLARGLYAAAPNLGGATLTTLIGLDIAAMTVGGTNYGIRNASNLVQTGYAKFGGVTTPTNTTDGDVTVNRLSVLGGGSDGAFSATNGEVVRVSGSMTDTSTGAKAYFLVNPLISPATDTASTTDFRTLYYQAILTDSGGAIPGLVRGGYFEVRNRNSKATGTLTGLYSVPLLIDSSSPATVGAVTTAAMYAGSIYVRPSGTSVVTLTNGYGLDLSDLVHTGSGFTATNITGIIIGGANGTVTNVIGLDIQALSAGSTLNIGIRNASPTVWTPAAAQTVSNTTTLNANATVKMLTSTADKTFTSAPTVTDGVDGQIVRFINVGTFNITFSDQGTLASSNLRLSAATVTIAPRGSLELMYSSTVGDWVQIGVSQPL